MYQFFAGTAYAINLIYNLALYLAIAFSLYRIAINNNVKHAWIAFIPIVQYSIIGVLCEEYILWGIRIRPLSLVLIGLEFLQVFSSLYGGLLLFPIRIAVNLLMVLVLHKFFYLFQPQKALLYTALSLLGRLPVTIILFVIKDYPMFMSAGAYPYPFAHRK